MKTAVWLITIGVLASSANGCGAGGPAAGPVEFPSEALMVLPSAGARYQVVVRTSPQPPVKGLNAVQLSVTDAVGEPADDLAVAAVPWMPSHGHGGRATTVVEAAGEGSYVITNVYLYMEGSWELRSTLGSGSGSDTVTPVFDVR
jgi:hypothetical protein